MKIIAKFFNYRFQAELISMLREEKIPHRVKANKDIQLAEKWEDALLDLSIDIVEYYFEEMAITMYDDYDRFNRHVKIYAENNIIIITLFVNDIYYIIKDDKDSGWYGENILSKESHYL